MKKISNKLSGFTLIELMVVITIIGILATIVLPNLTTVRGRGQDTAVKEQMTQFRATAALFYDDNYGYTTGTPPGSTAPLACVSTNFPAGSVFTTAEFTKVITGLTANSSVAPICAMGSNGTKSQSWAIAVKMRTNTGYWCVDSAGTSKSIPAADAANMVASGEAQCL